VVSQLAVETVLHESLGEGSMETTAGNIRAGLCVLKDLMDVVRVVAKIMFERAVTLAVARNDYVPLLEAIHLLASSKNAERSRNSIGEARKGKKLLRYADGP